MLIRERKEQKYNFKFFRREKNVILIFFRAHRQDSGHKNKPLMDEYDVCCFLESTSLAPYKL